MSSETQMFGITTDENLVLVADLSVDASFFFLHQRRNTDIFPIIVYSFSLLLDF